MTTALAGGRYLLGEVVGSGAMSQVRRARDTLLDRDVAVKVFRDDLSDEMAKAEMTTLAGLDHPRLVQVHDAGTGYLVMELVDGPHLGTRCGSLSPDEVAAIGADVAEALSYVHSRGVVHRDVKPANVLLSRSGAKLADFGIARIVDAARQTGTGLTVGTAPYLAPEQVTGQEVGPPADVYALGLVLLECLTGRREYTGGAVECALARLHRQPEVPVLPGPWSPLLRAMTARNPADRPTAAEVVQTLRGSHSGTTNPPTVVLPRVVRPSTPVRRLDRLPAPLRTPLAAACAAAALLLVVLVAAGAGGEEPKPKTPLEQHLDRLEQVVQR